MGQLLTFNDQLLIEKYLPHNFLAEKMILNCLLINSECIENVISNLSVETFYFQNHQEIYKAIIFMYKNNLPIDILTFVTFLQENGLLQKIGGIKILIELIDQTPNTIYLEDYISLVKDKFLRRSLIKLGYELINSSYITNLSIENILNNFENKLFSLTSEIRSQRLFSSTELLNNILFELKDKSLNPKISGITSGFDNLDLMIQGFQRTDLIVLAGRPSTGKTALSLNIGLNIIKSLKLPVLFFSLEMSKEQIMYRLLSIEANINQVKLRTGKLSQNDWIRLNKVIKVISKLPIFIDDTPNLSVQDIRSKIKTILFEQSKLGLIIIDYLQLLQNSNSKTENRVQELSQMTRTLKNIAREFDIPVLALSQLSRNVENRVDKKPILSDLRESGSIEQDADLVLMLYNKSESKFNQTNNADTSIFITELIIAKQRNGPIGSVNLKFDPKKTKFFSMN
uniref:DNA-replication helicase subunit n=1 Tax=Haslea karadagensis TaxID=1146996 RepID=UPI002203A39F|nr:DNA-replication helicase subunit [Haslea karadagensis]UXN44855.1 DNA-replication helicase subunit [Haslea karadagensis]UXN45116.1 DNA-replication helicase subunit [Haslea karadagensis]